MIFERSVNGIFGCIIFCVLLRSPQVPRSSEQKGLPPSFSCMSPAAPTLAQGAGSPASKGSLPPAPLTSHGHGETAVELAAGPRSQGEPRAHLCPSQDPLWGPDAERAPRPTCAFSPCAAVQAWGSEMPSGTHTWGCSRQSNRARREEASGPLGVSPLELCGHVVAQPGSQRLSALVPLEKAAVFPPRMSSGGQVREGGRLGPTPGQGEPAPSKGPTDQHPGRLKATEPSGTSRSSKSELGTEDETAETSEQGRGLPGAPGRGGRGRQGRGGPRAAASRGDDGSRRQ